ncbi:MAG: hypothetical protein JXQ75_01145, partial [Phycisphaerae bacterium]|nr:hypothetical protein [Phycisphaerae bacterium]
RIDSAGDCTAIMRTIAEEKAYFRIKARPRLLMAVRRKNSIPRLGQRRLCDARSDSANDDGLPAPWSAHARWPGTATPRPPSTTAGLGMPVDGGAVPRDRLRCHRRHRPAPVSGAQAAMVYSWWSLPSTCR